MIKALNSVQIEQLRQISAYLYQVRQKQAIALEDVAQHTYIPLRLLQALEAGEVDRLPEPVYIKGFIRRYADCLGLDGAEIADALELDAAPPEPEAPAPPQTTAPVSPAQTPPAQTAAISSPRPSSAASDNPPQRPLWKYGVAGLAGLGLVGAIAGISQLGSRPTNPPSPNAASTSTTSTGTTSTGTTSTGTTSNTTPDAPSAATSNPATASSPQPSPSSPSSTAPVQVSVNLTDASWMEVVVDGKTTFAGTLPKGTQRTWSGKQSVLLRSGNAGAVQVSYNDGETKTLGALGSVVDARFPPAPADTPNPGQSNP